ncbi:hypothetical protein R3P38DRAFT_3116885, partial [Favolaschia claudopus]
GTLEDLRNLQKLVRSANEKHRIRYLPAFYHFLDPSKIPGPLDWESPQSERLPPSHRAYRLRLAGHTTHFDRYRLLSKSLPRMLGSSVPWTHFLHQYHDHLASTIESPDNDEPPYLTVYAWFVVFAAADSTKSKPPCSQAPPDSAAFSREHGVSHRHSKRRKHTSPSSPSLARFLGSLTFSDTAHIAELISGAGGAPHDLAPFIVHYLAHIAARHSTALTQAPGYHFSCVLRLIMVFTARKAAPDHIPYKNFIDVLAAHGLVLAGVAMGRGALMVLQNLLTGPQGVSYCSHEPSVRDSCRHWLRCPIQFGSGLDEEIRFFVRILLPPNMVYYHVAVAMSEVINDLFELVQSPELQILRACDNLACGEIHERSRLRRCSRCRSSYYCTRECQIADWRDGGHSKICESFTALTLNESQSCQLGFRERQFLRALVQEAYDEDINFICVEQLMLMAEDQQPFILFDFTCTPQEVSVESVHFAQWEYLAERARASRGRMRLHVIRVVEGLRKRLWVIPLRSSSNFIEEDLQWCLDIGVEETLANRGDLVEIH